MQVLVISLRSTETGRVSQTCLKFISRLIKQVHTRTKNKLVNQIMFIHTQSDEHCQLIHTPLVLDESSCHTDILFHITVIAGHNIV